MVLQEFLLLFLGGSGKVGVQQLWKKEENYTVRRKIQRGELYILRTVLFHLTLDPIFQKVSVAIVLGETQN